MFKPIDKTRLVTLAFLVPLLIWLNYSAKLHVRAEQPTWLEEGNYAQYQQVFSIGETHILYWQITQLTTSVAEIKILSHGIQFNFSTMGFQTVSGGGIVTISRDTGEILEFAYLNGTVTPHEMVGQKLAFWISTAISASTSIENIYDRNVTPSLVGPLHFPCLPAPRLCWLTENTYSSSNSMSRYYDTETGIVLKILTFVSVAEEQINIIETLNDTNIAALKTNPIPPYLPILVEIGIVSLVVLGAGVIIIWLRKRKARAVSA